MTDNPRGIMETRKRKKLEAAGWRVGSAADFLELSAAEEAYVALRLTLSDALRKRREALGLTQSELARRVGSSQSRIAKAEASDPGVSIDLLVRVFLATGASRAELGRVIQAHQPQEA
jgi:DNA-binding XRE family transcriptional regulator